MKHGTISENQAITFRDFVNCETDVTTALLSVEEKCDTASTR